MWNLYLYPTLGQWFSFGGGVFLVLANTLGRCWRTTTQRRKGCRRQFKYDGSVHTIW
jgi:hypothetical protein